MPRRLPQLNALKAFDAAARHESFTRAAEELCVTQGAVSHQVKALEEELGSSCSTANASGWSSPRLGVSTSSWCAMLLTASPSAPNAWSSARVQAS
jgi:hypothetical protein